ncbi:hypothetical protein BZA70DRAFT_270139, partial [Myxozyma melibiosi]
MLVRVRWSRLSLILLIQCYFCSSSFFLHRPYSLLPSVIRTRRSPFRARHRKREEYTVRILEGKFCGFCQLLIRYSKKGAGDLMIILWTVV